MQKCLYFSFHSTPPFSLLPVPLYLAGLAHALQLIFKPVRCMVDVLPQGEKMETGWMFFWKVETLFNLVLLVNFSVSQLGGNSLLTLKSL